MELKEVETKLNSALRTLLDNDEDLFRANVMEPSISSSLQTYLKPRFPSFNVDCEYNKYGMVNKTNDKGEEIRPDINIHKRLILKRHNLIVIELKKGKYPNRNDIKKLMYFTNNGGKYRYKYGFL